MELLTKVALGVAAVWYGPRVLRALAGRPDLLTSAADYVDKARAGAVDLGKRGAKAGMKAAGLGCPGCGLRGIASGRQRSIWDARTREELEEMRRSGAADPLADYMRMYDDPAEFRRLAKALHASRSFDVMDREQQKMFERIHRGDRTVFNGLR